MEWSHPKMVTPGAGRPFPPPSSNATAVAVDLSLKRSRLVKSLFDR